MKRILTIAGSDSSGGAGIQADLKTIMALGGYGMSAITALTAQNTQGVFEVIPCDPAFVSLQMELILSDIGADAIKTGMLFDRAIIETVSDMLKRYPTIPYIIDPVMVSTSGSVLLKDNAIEKLIEQLLPNATLITPNIPEAQLLSGITIRTRNDMQNAARRIIKMGAKAVLIKGGHGQQDVIENMLHYSSNSMPQPLDNSLSQRNVKTPLEINTELKNDLVTIFEHPRIDSTHTHGTGCTMASAITTLYAQGKTLQEAIKLAGDYVSHAITHAPNLGKGHGPLNHGWMLETA